MTTDQLLTALRAELAQVQHQRGNLQPFTLAEYRRLLAYEEEITREIERQAKKEAR